MTSLSLALSLAVVAGCSNGSSATGPTADASDESPLVEHPSDASDEFVSPPPSADCRYIEDNRTCVDNYVLNNDTLYECGDLFVGDPYDGGAERPFNPPLPIPPYDCRNVDPPVTEAGVSMQHGALWCCDQHAEACVRAISLDARCNGSRPGATAAYSCPRDGGVYPGSSADGGACAALDAADASLTPSLAPFEALLCCPP